MKRVKKILKALKPRRGFTLIEILIAVVISFIIMAAVFEVFIAQRKRYITEDAILEAENSGHFSIEYLTRIIQNSGYNIESGMKIESASDHYFTAVMDENDNGVGGIEAADAFAGIVGKAGGAVQRAGDERARDDEEALDRDFGERGEGLLKRAVWRGGRQCDGVIGKDTRRQKEANQVKTILRKRLRIQADTAYATVDWHSR